MTVDITFLHTAKIHIDTFEGLIKEMALPMRATHVIENELLECATEKQGVDDELGSQIQSAMVRAADSGAKIVMCTCSSIGGAAEKTSMPAGVQAMRIDRAMADLAVATGPNILVLAAVEATINPTLELLNESAEGAKVSIQPTVQVVDGAWAHFLGGDPDTYAKTIADHIQNNISGFDVIVLAQASMAPAASLVETAIPVLSSPRLGLKAAIDFLS